MNKIISKIPILNTPDEPLIDTTQSLVPIADITHDLVLHKDGGASLVMESTSLNFGLLSEKEQEAVVAAYAALINSLSFPLQIFVQTHKKDVSRYIEYLKQSRPQIDNPKLTKLMDSYINFISETIKKKNVLEKSFYIIIPFSRYELGLSKKSFSLNPGQKEQLPYEKKYIIKKATTALIPKRDHLIRQASRLGLQLRQLDNEELLKLYYGLYNPDTEAIKTKEPIEEHEDTQT